MKKISTLVLVLVLTLQAYCQSGTSQSKEVYISKIPKPIAPAELRVYGKQFIDNNNNNLIDANEQCSLKFTIKNEGNGDAYKIIVKVNQTNNALTHLLDFDKTFDIDKIPAHGSKDISIAIKGSENIITDKANFKVEIKEANGFDADPFEMEIGTQKFLNPQIEIVENKFSSETGGALELGKKAILEILIQNTGQGDANNINIKFTLPENIFPADETNYYFSKLETGESKKIQFEFFSNKKYDNNTIPVNVDISESYGKYGTNKRFNVEVNQILAKTDKLEIPGQYHQQQEIPIISLTSDVDKNIPESINNAQLTINNKYRYALIIGNEDYSSYQPGLNTEANVEFARNDANVFKLYCEKTLGIPQGNITYITDATAGKMKQGIDKMNKLIKNTDGKSEVFFYYAGHGLPDEKTKEAYIIPVDVSGTDLQNGIKLGYIYQTLTEFPSQRVTVFLDACFSGGARNQGLVAARTIKLTPQSDYLKGNILVFTASSGEQSSLPYKEKQHGMFTYYLLKELQETKGDVSYSDLYSYIKQNVSLESVNTNNKEQNPQVNVSKDVEGIWGKWKMR